MEPDLEYLPKVLEELFNKISLDEAMICLKCNIDHIENQNPYGLTYGDLYHIVEAYYLIGFRDQNVLEFGGSLPIEFINKYLRPNSWHSVTLDLYESDYRLNDNEIIRDQVILKSLKKGNYYTNLGLQELWLHQRAYGSEPYYTRIFSVAAFEHLRRPHICLKQLYDLCCVNTRIYSFFTPVWSAPNGHHWSECPISLPYYVHLYLNHQEFLKYFMDVQKESNYLLAELHAHAIYKSTRINRLTPPEWQECFSNSKFYWHCLAEVGKISASSLDLPQMHKKLITISLQSESLCSGYKLIGEKL